MKKRLLSATICLVPIVLLFALTGCPNDGKISDRLKDEYMQKVNAVLDDFFSQDSYRTVMDDGMENDCTFSYHKRDGIVTAAVEYPSYGYPHNGPLYYHGGLTFYPQSDQYLSRVQEEGFEIWHTSNPIYVKKDIPAPDSVYETKDGKEISLRYSEKNAALNVYHAYCYWHGRGPNPSNVYGVTKTIHLSGEGKLESIIFCVYYMRLDWETQKEKKHEYVVVFKCFSDTGKINIDERAKHLFDDYD